jgi:hypothetical protein
MALPAALREPVTDLASAKAWIAALLAADLAFHFDDDPSDCLSAFDFTDDEYEIIGARRDALYGLEWGPRAGLGAWYCPIGYLMHLERESGALEWSEERGLVMAFDDLTIVDRDDLPGYDYGAPGRFEVQRDGVTARAFDCYADLAAAFPCFMTSERFRLCLDLENPARLAHASR